MWIEIKTKTATRLINTDRVEIITVDNDTLWIIFPGDDGGAKYTFDTEAQARTEFERIKGLLMEVKL